MASEIRTMYIVDNRDLRVQKSDVMRYLHSKDDFMNFDKLLRECVQCIYEAVTPRGVYTRSRIGFLDDDVVELDFAKFRSHSLWVNLKRCKEAYVMAITLGEDVDRTIEKYVRILGDKAAMCDAVASAYAEAFMAYMSAFISRNIPVTQRYSPGYGDFLPEYQKDILAGLDADEKIGVFPSGENGLTPSKSLVAIMGIKK